MRLLKLLRSPSPDNNTNTHTIAESVANTYEPPRTTARSPDVAATNTTNTTTNNNTNTTINKKGLRNLAKGELNCIVLSCKLTHTNNK